MSRSSTCEFACLVDFYKFALSDYCLKCHLNFKSRVAQFEHNDGSEHPINGAGVGRVGKF